MIYADEIRAQIPRARTLSSYLSAERFNLRPATGAWSVAECLAHLNSTNREYGNTIEAGIRDARARGLTGNGPFELGRFDRLLVWTVEPPVRMRFKAPRMFLPQSDLDRESVLRDWDETHGRLLQLADDAAGLDLNRAKVISPPTPVLKISLLASFAILAAHDRRHLWQAQRVTEQI